MSGLKISEESKLSNAQKNEEAINTLKIVKIQRTCVHDGPGLRTTIFFKGCGLKCIWCQNPEALSLNNEDELDKQMSVNEIIDVVVRDKAYYLSSRGGVTLSGGEPFLQKSESLVGLLKAIKKEKIHIVAETALYAPWENIEKAAPFIDLFLVDLKIVGNDNQHEKLTGNKSDLIHENLKKLCEIKAKIKIRMVIVPGLNDSEYNIKKACEFLKKLNIKSIELLKYHNMYEDKAKRLGIKSISLYITPEQSLASVNKAIDLFNKYGIKAEHAKFRVPAKPNNFTQRVIGVQKDIRDSGRALCVDVSKLKTEYYKKNGFTKPNAIHRSERLKYVLENKKIKVYPQELLVGNFTSKRVAGQVWEEHYGSLDITFLYKINRQKPVSFQCSRKERYSFYTDIFPFWIKHSLITKVNSHLSDFIMMLARSSEMIAGFNNNMAAIAHFIVNFERILRLGTTGMIKEIKQMSINKPLNNQDFYKGAIIALKALENFALRYSYELKGLSRNEKDPIRKKELEKMAEICAKVPKYPAETFYEALQSMMFLQIALCIESYENAVSFGRFDQILYPYYKKDLEEGRITYDEAKELICLFILKMDEAILVNDGDSFLNVSKLFETLSTDQALTFGGIGKDGKDATNDITYMLVDACELQPLAVNMIARVNKDSPKKYLDRLAEIYINGCPMPELFADNIYIDSILKHYSVPIESARNYAIVGCVEPNASDDHYGNTDCANVNLALVFLQALKGQKHDLWNFGKMDQIEKIIDRAVEFAFDSDNSFSKLVLEKQRSLTVKRNRKKGFYIYNPPSTMEELQERFEQRLKFLASAILADHQKIEKVLCENFTTPLASSLYNGCIESGKDVYEGGAQINTSGIQAIGVTDVADSLYAIDEIVFKKKLYSIDQIIEAIEDNFESAFNQKIRSDLLSVPKFGDDSSKKSVEWVNYVMGVFNKVLDEMPHPARDGKYTAGYYALNVNDRYGKRTGAMPSGRLKGTPLANSVTPHYDMESSDLFSSLNSIAGVNFTDYAVNGTTVTFTIDAALFQDKQGIDNLSSIFKTFLTTGGMQFQPNVISKDILMDAYNHPEKYKYLMVRVAGYCAYFNELSDELKKIIINRNCYS